MKVAEASRKRISRLGQDVVWAVYDLVYLHRQTMKQPVREAFPNEEDAGGAGQLGRESGASATVARAEAGGQLAVYTFRFIAMPLEYLHSCLKDVATMHIRDWSDRLVGDGSYCQRMFDLFFQRADEGDISEGAEFLREELFHHKHLYRTSLWVFTQGFAMLSRFATSFICFNRLGTSDWKPLWDDKDYREVTRFAFNTYCTAACLRRSSMSAIEGYAHYRELLDERATTEDIVRAYDERTADAAKALANLERRFGSIYGVACAESLVEHIAKRIVDLPLVSYGRLGDFSYFRIRQQLSRTGNALSLNPHLRLFQAMKAFDEDLPSDPEDCRSRIEKAITVSGFENQFSPGLLWYFTRDFVPTPLVWFLVSRLLLSRFGLRVLRKIVWDFIARGGKQFDSYAYSGLPAMRVHSLDGKVLFCDPGRSLFGKDCVFIASPGDRDELAFEFGIRGSSCEMYQLIQFQAVIMHAVETQISGSKKDRDARRDFMFKWLPALEERRAETEKWLSELDDECEGMVKSLRDKMAKGHDPFAGADFDEFAISLESLAGRQWRMLSHESNRQLQKSILLLGDCLYTHGFS